jgi:hypothetical protein
MTRDKDKPPWFQQYGSHIDSLPVEHNSPAPMDTRLVRSKEEIQAEFPGWEGEGEPTKFVCSCGEEIWGRPDAKWICGKCRQPFLVLQ